MHPILRFLHDLSYSARGLKLSCAVLVGVGAMSSAAVGLLSPLQETPGGIDSIEQIYHLYRIRLRNDDVPLLSPPATLDPGGLFRNVFDVPADAWLERLTREANHPSPQPGVRFALGLWRFDRGEYQKAVYRFHAENADHPHPLVRSLELDAALRDRNFDHLDRLVRDPAYADETDSAFFMRYGWIRNDWSMILRHFWRAQYGNLRFDSLLLSLLAGLVWLGLLAGLLPGRIRPVHAGWLLVAIVLGWVSTWPTVWAGMALDPLLPFDDGPDFVSALLFHLTSVGLREELCKLLLFTPLLFRVLRAERDGEALILGAAVGLGFAIEENIGYVASSTLGGVGISRFVSANMLHPMLTGATALALTRVLRNPGQWLGDGLQVLAMAIGLHGVYNALLTAPVPGLGDLSYFSGTALAGAAFLFFREARSLASLRGRRISLTGLFCWGFCLLFNLELIRAAAILPWNQALNLTGGAALTMVFTGYIFLHMIDEPVGP